MRFIVDLYRWLIFLFFGIIIFVVTNLLLAWAEGKLSDGVASTILLIGIGIIIISILSVGCLATFISIHDRHLELADNIGRLAETFEYHHSQLEGQMPPLKTGVMDHE